MQKDYPDKSYKAYDFSYATFDQLIALDKFTHQLDGKSTTFGRTTFGTIKGQELASDLTKKYKTAIADMVYVDSNFSTAQAGPVTLSEPTHIRQNSGQVYRQLQNIYLDKRHTLSDQQKVDIIEAMAYIQRANQITVGGKLTIGDTRTDLEQWNLQQIVEQMVPLYVIPNEKSIKKINPHLALLLVRGLSQPEPTFLVDQLTVFYYKQLTQYLPLVQGVIGAFVKSLAVGASGLAQAQEKLMSWGDFKTNPIGAMVGIMGGLNSVLTSYLSMQSVFIEGSGKVIDEAFKTTKAKEKNKDKGKTELLTSMMQNIQKNIFNQLKDLTSIIMNLVVMSVHMFVSVMQTMIKMLKMIQETSPVLKGIMEYISLAVTMFFLPFFTAFAEPLLDGLLTMVYSIITYSTSMAQSFKRMVERGGESQVSWKGISKGIEKFLTRLLEELVPESCKIIPFVVDFLLDFTKIIIKNADLIHEMLKEGINAYTDLMRGGMLKVMLSLSDQVFTQIVNFKTTIVNQIIIIFQVQRLGFGFAQSSMRHVKAVIQIIFTILGQITGALVAYRAWQIATAMSLGLLAPSLPLQLQTGQQAGQITGEQSQLLVISKFIDPMAIEDMDKIIPEFAKGGKILKTPGGLYGIMAEHGEGEFAIPQSKLKLFRGDNNIIIRVKGKTYNPQEIDKAIKELEMECPITFMQG